MAEPASIGDSLATIAESLKEILILLRPLCYPTYTVGSKDVKLDHLPIHGDGLTRCECKECRERDKILAKNNSTGG